VSAAAPVPPAGRKGAVAGGALPEHAQQEGGEQRRVDEAEDQLQKIHDVVELRGEIGGGDREHDADDRGDAAHRQVMRSGGFRADVALINVVGEDRVEGRDVARHAGHERRHQRGEPDAQHAARIELSHQRGERLIVIVAVTFGGSA
jgi:hypothetical protein